MTPSEVESRLLEHPLVAEAAVVGLTDGDGLVKPVACVVTRGLVTQDELIAWCREGLAHFKCPRAVVFVGELPKTATGKLQRFKVRELVAHNVNQRKEFTNEWGRRSPADRRREPKAGLGDAHESRGHVVTFSKAGGSRHYVRHRRTVRRHHG